eukprot:scaffold525_cov170-Ochromonas_danica.AAC.6
MVELLSAVSPTSTSTSMEDHPPSQTLVNSSLNHVVDEVLVLPQEEEIEDFDHQIAGHVSEKVRRYRQHFILKPQVKKDLFTRETLFYEEIFSTQLQQQLLLEEEGEGEEGEGEGEKKSETRRQKKIIEGLRECLPVFHGVVFIPNPTCPPTTTSTTTSFGIPTTNLLPCLCLQDLTQGYTIPCLIDIKMGQQTYEPTASRDKINREQVVYDSIRSTTTTTTTSATSTASRPHCRVKMIDFAHVVKTTREEGGGGGVDEGYLHGLDNLIRMLTLIVEGVESENNDEGEFNTTLCQEYRQKFLYSHT